MYLEHTSTGSNDKSLGTPWERGRHLCKRKILLNVRSTRWPFDLCYWFEPSVSESLSYFLTSKTGVARYGIGRLPFRCFQCPSI